MIPVVQDSELQAPVVQEPPVVQSRLIENLTEYEAEILLRSFDTAENLEGQLQRSICERTARP